MKFAEALELMKQGKMILHKDWPLEEGYLVKMDGMKHIWKILTFPTPNAGNHIPSVEELDSDGWEVKEIGQWPPSRDAQPVA